MTHPIPSSNRRARIALLGVISLLLCLLAGPGRLAAQDAGAGPRREPDSVRAPDPAADPTAGLAREDARIQELRLYTNGDDLYTDVALTGTFVQEVRERIEAGLEVTFTYQVELYKKRKHWFDKRLVRKVVKTQVVRDNLAGRYILTRSEDGEEMARITTEDPKKVRRWMNRLTKQRLIPVEVLAPDESKLEDEDASQGDRLQLRVKAKIKDDFVLLFIPWDFETDWGKLVVPLEQLTTTEAPEAAEAPSVSPPGGD